MKSIALIGMSGSGKTTVGRLLAQKLNYIFIDTDQMVEEREGLSIGDIFEKYGEPYFRTQETASIAAAAQAQYAVIATGGGVILDERNISLLKQACDIIYLDTKAEKILKQADFSVRPLLKKQPEKVFEMLQVREPLYRKYADFIVDNQGTIAETAENILCIYGGKTMKLGLSAPLVNIGQVEAQGYDYIEGNAVALASETEEKYAELLELVGKSNIKPECFCVMVPGDIMLVGDAVDHEKLEKHLDFAYKRVAKIGGKIMVWGSGYSRKCPEGFDRSKAFEQLVQAGKIAAKYAAKYCITVVVEPLNPNETNMINKVSEGAELVRAIGSPNVQLLADLYHVANSGEGTEFIEKELPLIKHIHIADSTSEDVKVREFPTPEDKYKTSEFIAFLKKIGYNGRISLECSGRENYDEQIALAYQALRKWMNA